MANGEKEKSIEMRLAAIEDKLRQLNVTEDEMKAYQKVASLMGTTQAGTGLSAGTSASYICYPILRHRLIPRFRFIHPAECNECGPCNEAGGGLSGGGGFGGFGG